MIWALLAAYLLGGGGGISGGLLTSAAAKQLGEQTKTIVMDPARSVAAEQSLDKLRKALKAFEKKFTKSGGQLTKMFKDHAADKNQSLGVLDDLNTTWAASQQQVIDLRFELKDSLSREEWAALFVND